MKSLSPKTPVMVTGASSGIGAEFARRFAERGHDVTVVARRINRLEQIAEDLRTAHGVTVTPLQADLETETGRETVAAALRAHRGAWVLVNNAGFGSSGRFSSLDPERERGEVAVNVSALHHLTTVALPLCVKAKGGGIINVASTAGFQALPYMATYAATKAFVLHFTEAIAEEVRGSGVRVLALCPGPVRTEFAEVAGASALFETLFPMDVHRCVADALRAFDRNRTICIPGLTNGVLAGSTRLVPRLVTRRLAGAVLGRR